MKALLRKPWLTALSLIVLLSGCAEFQKILLQESVNALSQCEFRLKGIRQLKVMDVPFDNLNSLKDISWKQGLALSQAFTQGTLPTAFVLDMGVKNPNNGQGGLSKATATLNAFPFTLFIDDVKTIQGNIDKSYNLPETLDETVIPLNVNLDLAKFFKERGYKNIMNLALALGGAKGSAANVKLRAKPSIKTPMGPIEYPDEINILERQFGAAQAKN